MCRGACLAARGTGIRVILTEETGWIEGSAHLSSGSTGRAHMDRIIWMHAHLSRISGASPQILPEKLSAHRGGAPYPRSKSGQRPRSRDLNDARAETAISLAVLEEMLAPFVSGGRILCCRATEAGCREYGGRS